MCSYIFGVVLFRILGQTWNPEFQLEFLVTNFPEQNSTGIPKNSIFWRWIFSWPDIWLNPSGEGGVDREGEVSVTERGRGGSQEKIDSILLILI